MCLTKEEDVKVDNDAFHMNDFVCIQKNNEEMEKKN